MQQKCKMPENRRSCEGMRLTFEGDEWELKNAQKIWTTQVIANPEYLVQSHSVDHKNDKVDMPFLAELMMTVPPFSLHRLFNTATVRIPAKIVYYFSTPSLKSCFEI